MVYNYNSLVLLYDLRSFFQHPAKINLYQFVSQSNLCYIVTILMNLITGLPYQILKTRIIKPEITCPLNNHPNKVLPVRMGMMKKDKLYNHS